MKYRPDIDGLRALAVLSVLIFHVDPKLLPGGFVGVDMFFVILDYLISIIMWDAFSSPSFSYLAFSPVVPNVCFLPCTRPSPALC